jgi:hypothetical protein
MQSNEIQSGELQSGKMRRAGPHSSPRQIHLRQRENE